MCDVGCRDLKKSTKPTPSWECSTRKWPWSSLRQRPESKPMTTKWRTTIKSNSQWFFISTAFYEREVRGGGGDDGEKESERVYELWHSHQQWVCLLWISWGMQFCCFHEFFCYLNSLCLCVWVFFHSILQRKHIQFLRLNNISWSYLPLSSLFVETLPLLGWAQSCGLGIISGSGSSMIIFFLLQWAWQLWTWPDGCSQTAGSAGGSSLQSAERTRRFGQRGEMHKFVFKDRMSVNMSENYFKSLQNWQSIKILTFLC